MIFRFRAEYVFREWMTNIINTFNCINGLICVAPFIDDYTPPVIKIDFSVVEKYNQTKKNFYLVLFNNSKSELKLPREIMEVIYEHLFSLESRFNK